MKPSTVYFADFRTDFSETLPMKFSRLIRESGLDQIDFDRKFVAIKIHFGEAGNLAHLRPAYARALAQEIKRLGGKPFLTDCNTLYVGARKNAIDHLTCAETNGFNLLTTGCQNIIADGLKGTDEVEVPIDLNHCKTAKIGRAVMDADIIISLNHFKCHEATGFGGAIKNLGMGCGSRAGKMEMHNSGKPKVDTALCISCGACFRNCAHGAISFIETKAFIDQEICVGCGRCIGVCPTDAVQPTGAHSNQILWEKMNEYTYAVLKERPSFHISLLMDVSPFCDCHAENDVPIIPNVGMFASLDPVAIDRACADASNKMPIMPGSVLDSDRNRDESDLFKRMHPETDWRTGLQAAEEIGLGSQSYELIDIDNEDSN